MCGHLCMCLPYGSVGWILLTRLAQQTPPCTEANFLFNMTVTNLCVKVLEPVNTVPCHERSDFAVCPARGATRSWAYVLEDAGCLSTLHSQMQPKLQKVCIPSLICQD